MHYGSLTIVVFVEGAIFLAFNVVLVCVAMALVEDRRPLPVIVEHLRHSGPAFLIMGSMAALAVALWTVDPPLLLLLAGPLLTLGLYQRYARSTRVARLAAETDSLTGLGNHRAYKHTVRAAVDVATRGQPVTLCLVDIDNFKGINDTHGHAAGDEALADVAPRSSARLGGGPAFRLGGDEFALLLERHRRRRRPSGSRRSRTRSPTARGRAVHGHDQHRHRVVPARAPTRSDELLRLRRHRALLDEAERQAALVHLQPVGGRASRGRRSTWPAPSTTRGCAG